MSKDATSKYKSYLKEGYTQDSTKISNIARVLVYGSIAALWTVVNAKEFNPTPLGLDECIKLMQLLAVYALLDLVQYALATLGFYFLSLYIAKMRNETIRRRIRQVEAWAWIVFMLKLLTLLIILLYFVIKLMNFKLL